MIEPDDNTPEHFTREQRQAIGDTVKQIRRGYRWSKATLAEASGLPKAVIRRVEAGLPQTPPVYQALERALDLPEGTLYQPTATTTVKPAAGGLDLRHLALILDAGKEAAYDLGDPALTAALSAMTEVAVQLHLEPDGELFNVARDFAALADRLN